MFRFKQTVLVAFIIAVSLVGIYMVGCDSTSVDSSNVDVVTDGNNFRTPTDVPLVKYLIGNDTEQELILDDSPVKSSILNSVLNQSSQSASVNNAVSGKEWLEAQGYSYVESNSLIMIENEYNYYSDRYFKGFLEDKQFSKLTPDHKIVKTVIRADTITWMAFENPTQDSANHAALITYWRDGSDQQTVYVELDVSTAPPTSIREGRIIGGEFIPEDIGIESWWGCIGAGLVGAGAGCLLSNCGWVACVVVTGPPSAAVSCFLDYFWNR